MNSLPCGNTRCPLCKPQILSDIPESQVIKLPTVDPPKKEKKRTSNRGYIAPIITRDEDEFSSSWAIGSQNDRN